MCNVGSIKHKIVSKKVKKKVWKAKFKKVPTWVGGYVTKEVTQKQYIPTKPVKIEQKKAKIGWRFMFAERDGSIQPLNAFLNPWGKKIAKADSVPRAENKNGLYIFTSLKEALKQSRVKRGTVLCKVKYWGTVAVHEKGVRAEYAEILEMFTHIQDPTVTVYTDNSSGKEKFWKPLFRSFNPELKNLKISVFDRVKLGA